MSPIIYRIKNKLLIIWEHYFQRVSKNDKLPLTIPQQVELLGLRNLIIENEDKVKQFLYKTNYYRLNGYWRKYQINPKEEENKFLDNTTFEHIADIYELDASLRNLLLKGIGIFEVCFRTRFAYHMTIYEPDFSDALNSEQSSSSSANKQFLYLKKSSYKNVLEKESPRKLVKKIKYEMYESKEKFIKHHKDIKKRIPIWAAVEALNFSIISKMYYCWKDKEVIKKVNSSFEILKISQPSTPHIIHALVNLRNLCAHQARIWNRTVMLPVANKIWDSEVMAPIREKIWNSKVMVSIIEEKHLKGKKHLKNPKDINERSLLEIICVLMALVDQINDNKDYSKEVITLFEKNDEFFKGLIDPNL